MERLWLQLCFGAVLFTICCNGLAIDVPASPKTSPRISSHPNKQTTEQVSEEMPLVNRRPSLTKDAPSDEIPHVGNEEQAPKQTWNPFFPIVNPNSFINPFMSYKPDHKTVLFALLGQSSTALEMMRQRQDALLAFIEYSCPHVESCEKVVESKQEDNREELQKALNHWIASGKTGDKDMLDKFNAIMTAFEIDLDKATLRQNMMQKFMACACKSTTKSGTSLEFMFSEDSGVSEKMTQSLLTSGRSAAYPTFSENLISFFSQFPFFGGWFGPYSYNPWYSIFGGGYFPFGVFRPPVKPAYSAASVSSSTNGQASSAQVSSSTVGGPANGTPSNQNYVVSNPGGGTTQVATSTDGAGSSSVAVSSSSGRTRRQIFFGGPPAVAQQAVLAAQQTVLANQGIGFAAGQIGVQAGNIGVLAGQQAAQYTYG